jgi:predicted DsbA family dithiol-disulfide isomerase
MNTLPILEIYSSLECPFAYLATYRLRQVWPEYAGRVQIVWRSLSLEYINNEIPSKPGHEAEMALLKRIEPELPQQPWPRPAWEWPVTFWPAFEALACAQAQGPTAAFEMSWALRHAFFAEGRCLSLRHEILAVIQPLAEREVFNLARFVVDWDSGRYKGNVVAESRRGWNDIKLKGSPTFLLPSGRQVYNLAVGEVRMDQVNHAVRGYTPYSGDPLTAYRELLETVARTAK